MTFTEREQLAPGASEPPVSPMLFPFATPPVTVPPHVLATDGEAVAVMLLGKLSVNVTPVSAVVGLGLERVSVRRDASPTPVVLGEKLLASPAAMYVAVFEGAPV